MTLPEPRDWNTWDVQYHTAAVHLPSGIRVRLGVGTPDGQIVDDFTWRKGLHRLGHHTVDGEYAEVTVRCGEALVRLVFANSAPNVLNGLAELIQPAPHGYTVNLIVDRLPAAGAEEKEWQYALSSPTKIERIDFSTRIAFAPNDSGVYRFAWGEAADLDFDFDAARERALGRAIGSSGWLGRSAEGYQRALTWNTIIRSDLGRVITPTSRDFVSQARGGFYGTWALHGWDTFFCGLTSTWINHDYSRGIYEQILEQVTAGGFVPNRVSDERGRTDDRSQPPVGAYTVLKSYLSTGLSDETRDRRLLTETYPALLSWHDWWTRARRGPHGMLAWGSDPTDDPKSATVDSTRRESGLDDSPMYDEIQYDPATHTMDLADVGLNALHAADGEALAGIAELVGDARTAERLRAEVAETGRRIEETFWDETAGHYRNLRADGSFDIHLAPTMLYPLLGGVSDPARAHRSVETLLTPELLGGSPPLPSVSRSDPGYSRFYCRGRIWGPISFLVVEGLRRYRMDAHVMRIVDELLAIFRLEWEEHSHVHENYFSSPDEDIHPFEARSDFLLSWGNLLAYLAMQQMADARAGGWRFAHPGLSRKAGLTNLTLREGLLSIDAAERLRVTLDGAVLIDAPATAIVEDYQRNSDAVSAVVSLDAGPLVLGVPPSAGQIVTVRVGDAPSTTATVADGGTVAVELPADAERVHITIER